LPFQFIRYHLIGSITLFVTPNFHAAVSREAFNLVVLFWIFCGVLLLALTLTVLDDEAAVQLAVKTSIQQQHTHSASGTGGGAGAAATCADTGSEMGGTCRSTGRGVGNETDTAWANRKSASLIGRAVEINGAAYTAVSLVGDDSQHGGAGACDEI
jgi:hypothetical protein